MKTANIINQINAGVHIILENTRTNILMDVLKYEQKPIPWDDLKEILDRRFEEANKAVEEDDSP